LQRRERPRTPEAKHRASLHVVSETHVRNEATPEVRTHIASASTHHEKIDIARRQPTQFQTIRDCAAARLHGTTQIALVQLIRALPATEVSFQTEVPKVDVAIKKHLSNALGSVPGGMKALFLRQPERWICRTDCNNSRIAHR
jgi:hypothetical protein